MGVVALVVGYVGDQGLRDILRDGRWWALYGSGLLAILAGVRAPAVVRALMIGLTVFAGTTIAFTVLPAFDDALKETALIFDRGLLRGQFGNTALLLVPLAASVVLSARRPSPRNLTWVGMLATAIVLSLTRLFIVVAIGVVIMAILAAWLDDRGRPRRLVSPASAILPGIAVATGLVLAIGLAYFSLGVTRFSVSLTPGGVASLTVGAPSEDPLERLLLLSPRSDLGAAEGGRFATYRRALLVIEQAPVLGSGLGTLVEAPYTYGGEEFGTPGFLPNVDDAWLTVAMKAGIIGVVAFGLMLAAGVLGAMRGPRWMRPWLVPAWLGLIALTFVQSFATTGYGPFVLGLLIVLPVLGYADRSAARARLQE